MANAPATVAPPLPPLPPVPGGPQPSFRARSLAALIAALDDAVISYRTPGGDAIVVVSGGRVLDAIAAPAARPPLVGLEALNALAPADVSEVRAATVDRRVALTLPSYWREPDRVPPIPTRWVDAGGVVEAMVQPGRRGVIVLRSPSDLGLILFDQAGLVAAFSQQRPQPGRLETLAALLADGATTIHGRMADDSGQAGLRQSTVQEGGVAALPDPIERCRGQILQMTRSALHLHAEPVVTRFTTAPASPQGLLLAVDEVRAMRPRLVDPATMQGIAQRAEQIVRTAS